MRLVLLLAATAFLLHAAPALAAKEDKGALKTFEERASYAVGLSIGRNLARQGVDVKMDALVQGMEHALQEKEPLLTPDEFRETIAALNASIREKQRKTMEALAGKNKKEGSAFLAANGKKKGVVTLPSGLQYKILQAGKGKKPTKADSVITHYRGTFIDGTEFDSSYARGEPAAFPVQGVIAGWTEALQLMRPGAKWQLFIPAHLAYGEKGSGGRIGPNAVLIFEIELLQIQ